MPVVEADVKAAQVLRPPRCDSRDELLRSDSFRLCLEHDRRAMRIVGAHEMHLIPEHSLEAHPDIGLDVLHDVPDVKRAVGVGKRGSDKNLAGHPASLPEIAPPASAPRRAVRHAQPESFTGSNFALLMPFL